MTCCAPHRLNRSATLLALICAAFAGEAGAAAGRVDFATAGVTVAGTDGRERPLARGAELDNGDTVRTAEGRAQIRFTDGAYVSLQPNTEFSIKEYRYEGRTDGSETGFFALAKGAMRAVTGLVGRVNRNRYRISTPTATVGIRGTGGVIQVLNDGSTLVVGTSGIWSLTNPAGSIDVPAGVSGLAPSAPDQPPQQTSQVPESGPAPLLQQTAFAQGEERSPAGEPLIPTTKTSAFTPLRSGTGYASAFAHPSGQPPFAVLDGGAGQGVVDATFNSAGQLTALDFRGSVHKLGSGADHAEFGSDGILAWGRWVGPVSLSSGGSTEDFSANKGFHYVVGMPTPVMPTAGTATYSLLGATSPTYVDGSVAPGTFDGRLTVDFGQSTVGLDLKVGIDNKSYAIGGSASISGSTFSSMEGAQISGTNGACLSGCSASVEGFFSGATAERAGLGYSIDDFLAGKGIVGAAAFKKQ